ncbi:Sulfate/thiosulfate import ATP-binding protein CysA [Rosistilla carotiformis]|uniref:Sulfate/thiosulfate import ATP-binding protein CysA n=1 Tax=Rosistilla carotiformis TaxID=2528017 RepID=A0A518JV12_9BACT|nr:ABC transporter ATP-binding protein [Rosistilla carotiformis]QDV69380.1 Sulfate/thiosulfate import ATP-binding protein CysA [Rosistilla carotiformis]
MIEIEDATIAAGSFSLRAINLRVETGEYAVVMGKTGIGKTTILESICGLRKLRSGTIKIAGVDVTRWSAADRNVGYVPQDLALFPTMTVRQHLQFAMRLRKTDATKMKQRVDEIADILQISPLLGRNVRGLSGGEAQRVALGRALTFGPSVLLLDEPLSALDAATRQAAQTMLREINRQTGVTVLHVTHDPSEAQSMADRRFCIASEDGVASVQVIR